MKCATPKTTLPSEMDSTQPPFGLVVCTSYCVCMSFENKNMKELKESSRGSVGMLPEL